MCYTAAVQPAWALHSEQLFTFDSANLNGETSMTLDPACADARPPAQPQAFTDTQQSTSYRRSRSPVTVRRLLLCVVALLIINGAIREALAGVADTPLPLFSDGKQSVNVLTVAGVVSRQRLQTDFVCTSFDSSAVDIGVELFDPTGLRLNDVHAGNGALLNVGTGQTVTFGTAATKGYLENAIITHTYMAQASARVVATSTQVRCNVMVLDNLVTPPVTISTLDKGFQPVLGPVLTSAALPTFSDGQPATYAAVVPGAIKRNTMNTSFFCTSLASANLDVGVQVFGNDGTLKNDIATGNGVVLNVAPGATVTVSTTNTAAFAETTPIAMPTAAPDVSQGLARIVSTSGQVVCTAAQLDGTLNPPTSMSGLFGAN